MSPALRPHVARMTTKPASIAEQEAMDWLVRRQSEDWCAEDDCAFEAWLAASAEHRRAFADIEALWSGLDRYKTRTFPLRDAARAYRPPPPWPVLRYWAVGLALSLTVALVVLLGPRWWNDDLESVHRTARGERRTIMLTDGSQVEINTDTELRVRINSETRSVWLTRGEALFTVTVDTSRPFEVMSGNGRIRDLGTRFDVYQSPDQVSVTVLEGRVQITTDRANATPLAAGQQVAYSPNGELSSVSTADVAAVTAWREGRLVFQRQTLGEAVAQMARYHAVEIVFEDPTLATLKISGTFTTDDLRLFLSTLEATYPLKATVASGRLIRIDRAR